MRCVYDRSLSIYCKKDNKIYSINVLAISTAGIKKRIELGQCRCYSKDPWRSITFDSITPYIKFSLSLKNKLNIFKKLQHRVRPTIKLSWYAKY